MCPSNTPEPPPDETIRGLGESLLEALARLKQVGDAASAMDQERANDPALKPELAAHVTAMERTFFEVIGRLVHLAEARGALDLTGLLADAPGAKKLQRRATATGRESARIRKNSRAKK